MKHLFRIIPLLVGFLFFWACSQRGAPAMTSKAGLQAADATNDEITVLGLEKKWADAIVARNMEALNQIIADDFTGTSWTGDSYSKAKAVKDVEFKVY